MLNTFYLCSGIRLCYLQVKCLARRRVQTDLIISEVLKQNYQLHNMYVVINSEVSHNMCPLLPRSLAPPSLSLSLSLSVSLSLSLSSLSLSLSPSFSHSMFNRMMHTLMIHKSNITLIWSGLESIGVSP